MVKKYIPEKGDIVYVDFSPTQGHEQGGKRPALILSPQNYNVPSGLVLLCPITSVIKGYPLEVQLHEQKKVKGVVLADQVRSVDWNSRKIHFVEKAHSRSLQEVLKKIFVLLAG